MGEYLGQGDFTQAHNPEKPEPIVSLIIIYHSKLKTSRGKFIFLFEITFRFEWRGGEKILDFI